LEENGNVILLTYPKGMYIINHNKIFKTQ